MNHRTKLLRAYSQYRKGGILERAYIESILPEELISDLSSKKLLLVIQTLDKVYLDVKRSPKD
jgi:hypothetical protein